MSRVPVAGVLAQDGQVVAIEQGVAGDGFGGHRAFLSKGDLS